MRLSGVTRLAALGHHMTDDCLLVTGAEGYVGSRLVDRLRPRFTTIGLGRGGRSDVTCDLLDQAAVMDLARNLRPRWIVHAAGNKDVTACEASPRLAYDANVATTLNLVRAWPDVPTFYISTDYVFCGTRGRYTEASPTSPSTAYGRSKVCAEHAARLLAPATFTCIRASALYDASAAFLAMLATELASGRPVDCFVDAYYSPTAFDDFALLVERLIDAPERPPVVHVAGPRTTRYTFARQFAAACGFDQDLVRPVDLETSPGRLFPDLSLATPIATSTLGFVPTSHAVALRLIARGGSRARADALPSLLRFPRPDARRDEQRPLGGNQLRRDGGRVYAGRTLAS
jgi:dTDP-4-dehydrorhamnose reductase